MSECEEQKKPLRAARVASVVFAHLCAIGAVGAIGWYAHSFWGSPESKPGRVDAKIPFVAVDAVKTEKFNPPKRFIGHVEPLREVDILPQIEGYLREVKFSEGDEVKQGDLLFVIDDERYLADHAVAVADVDAAESKVVQAEAAVDRAKRLLGRLKSADERGITKTEMDAAETGLASDVAALGAAKASVKQAEAKLASTAFNLKHTKIYAPISGRIGKSLRYAGDFVSPSKGVLANIVQTDPMRVSFPITDREYLRWCAKANLRGAKIADTRRLRLRLADETIYPSVGNWDFTDNKMSAETATLMIRARFPNKERALVPNAYVTVLADEADPQPVPVIPLLALAKSGNASGVWIYSEDGTVHFREIEPGSSADGKIHVRTGLSGGERIVVQGVHKLGEGMKVTLVP